ncbi:MAG: AMP-binding protein, partial [Acidobacteriota bacterium]
MLGSMMDFPLLISDLIEYAGKYHADTEIVTRTCEGPIHRHGYREANQRSKRLAKALRRLGIGLGDRIGTLAWNSHRHVELYFGVSGMGAVCHTLNPRLFPEQLLYIVGHAEDRLIFVDPTFVPLAEALAPQLTCVEGWVILTDQEHMPETSLPNAHCYEALLDAEDDDYAWPRFDESTASSLCYTSGTTGNPKGVLYSHRSTVLHAYTACLVDTLGISSDEVVLPVVPMFHANAWGIPYSAALVGAKIVMPGARLDGASVWELLDDEQVTMTAGVPTVWRMLLDHMRREETTLSTVHTVVIGGSAAPRSMIDEFQTEHDVRVVHSWGMTETSPLGTVGVLKKRQRELPMAEQLDYQEKQGRVVAGVQLRLIDDDGKVLPHDGVAFGELQVRGPWVIQDYYKHEGGDALDAEGWFSTGDVATIDPEGYMQITDRS